MYKRENNRNRKRKETTTINFNMFNSNPKKKRKPSKNNFLCYEKKALSLTPCSSLSF